MYKLLPSFLVPAPFSAGAGIEDTRSRMDHGPTRALPGQNL